MTDKQDIVERLQAGPVWGDGSPIGSVVGEINGATMSEAATEIEALRERVRELEGKRRRVGSHAVWCFTKVRPKGDCDCGFDAARQALNKGS